MSLRYSFIRICKRNLNILSTPKKLVSKEDVPVKDADVKEDVPVKEDTDNILYDYTRMVNGDNNNNIP